MLFSLLCEAQPGLCTLMPFSERANSRISTRVQRSRTLLLRSFPVLAATSAEADALATIGAHRQTAGRAGATRKRCGDGAKAPTVASTGNSRRTRRCIESVAGESQAEISSS